MQTPSDKDIEPPITPFQFDSSHHYDRVFDGRQDVDVTLGEFGHQGQPDGREFTLDRHWVCVRRFDGT